MLLNLERYLSGIIEQEKTQLRLFILWIPAIALILPLYTTSEKQAVAASRCYVVENDMNITAQLRFFYPPDNVIPNDGLTALTLDPSSTHQFCYDPGLRANIITLGGVFKENGKQQITAGGEGAIWTDAPGTYHLIVPPKSGSAVAHVSPVTSTAATWPSIRCNENLTYPDSYATCQISKTGSASLTPTVTGDGCSVGGELLTRASDSVRFSVENDKKLTVCHVVVLDNNGGRSNSFAIQIVNDPRPPGEGGRAEATWPTISCNETFTYPDSYAICEVTKATSGPLTPAVTGAGCSVGKTVLLSTPVDVRFSVESTKPTTCLVTVSDSMNDVSDSRSISVIPDPRNDS